MRPKQILRFIQQKEQKNLQWNELHHLPAETLILKITEQIADFQAGHPQNEDIILAIIKTW